MRIYVPRGKEGWGGYVYCSYSETVQMVEESEENNDVTVTGNLGFSFFSSTFFLFWWPSKTLSFTKEGRAERSLWFHSSTKNMSGITASL